MRTRVAEYLASCRVSQTAVSCAAINLSSPPAIAMTRRLTLVLRTSCHRETAPCFARLHRRSTRMAPGAAGETRQFSDLDLVGAIRNLRTRSFLIGLSSSAPRPCHWPLRRTLLIVVVTLLLEMSLGVSSAGHGTNPKHSATLALFEMPDQELRAILHSMQRKHYTCVANGRIALNEKAAQDR